MNQPLHYVRQRKRGRVYAALVASGILLADAAIAAESKAEDEDLDVTMQVITDPKAERPSEVLQRIPLPKPKNEKAPPEKDQNKEGGRDNDDKDSDKEKNDDSDKSDSNDQRGREERGRDASEGAKERAREAREQRDEARDENRREREPPKKRPDRPERP